MTCLIIRTSSYVRSVLSHCPCGCVHSVYRKTVNIKFGDRLLALQASGSPLSPISMITELSADEMSALSVTIGEKVTACSDVLTIGDSYILSFREAEEVSLELPEDCSIDIRELRDAVFTSISKSNAHGLRGVWFPPVGEQPLDETLILNAASGRLSRCESFIRQRDFSHAAEELCGLVGLGIGLTPSGDDFLCGVLTAMKLVYTDDHPFVRELRARLGKRLADTNDISRAFLHCALDGQFSEAVMLLTRSVYPEAISSAFGAIGHSSGIDTLCGVYFTLSAV